jgi:hypothetical protein
MRLRCCRPWFVNLAQKLRWRCRRAIRPLRCTIPWSAKLMHPPRSRCCRAVMQLSCCRPWFVSLGQELRSRCRRAIRPLRCTIPWSVNFSHPPRLRCSRSTRLLSCFKPWSVTLVHSEMLRCLKVANPLICCKTVSSTKSEFLKSRNCRAVRLSWQGTKARFPRCKVSLFRSVKQLMNDEIDCELQCEGGGPDILLADFLSVSSRLSSPGRRGSTAAATLMTASCETSRSRWLLPNVEWLR